MKYLILLPFMALCCAAVTHGFFLKKDNIDSNAFATISNAKGQLINDARGVAADLKQSAQLKKQMFVNSVKAVANVKAGVVNTIRNAKETLIKNVVAAKRNKFAALQSAKESVAQILTSKKAKVNEVVAGVAAKSHNLLKYKVPLKETVTTLIGGAVNKVQSQFQKKKALLSSIKNYKTAALNLNSSSKSNQVFTLNNSQQSSQATAFSASASAENQSPQILTYVSNESPVIGKVYVQDYTIPDAQQLPGQYAYVAAPIGSEIYGQLPAESYGPAVIPI